MTKNAIVTGGSRGIGRAIAERLGKEGYNVVLSYNSNQEAAAEVVTMIKAFGVQAVAQQANVARPADVKALFAVCKDTFGTVDVVVNNAAISILGNIASFTDEEIDASVDVNMKGTFYVLREASNLVTEGGKIITISASFHGAPHPRFALYGTTKMAVEKLTIYAAQELGPKRINVNVVRPGPTVTDLFLKNVNNNDKIMEAITSNVPLGRLGSPEDVANACAFLVSDGAAYITGQVIGVNGGFW